MTVKASGRRSMGRLAPAISPFVILAIIGGYADYQRFLYAFVAGTLFAISMALGALLFVLWQRATRTSWAVWARRPMEWLSLGLAFSFIAIIIFAIAGRHIWSWWGGAPRGDGWDRWLLPTAFNARSFLYMIGFTVIASTFARRSRAQDVSGDPAISERLRALALPSFVLVFVLACGAATDWVASLHPGALSIAQVPLAGAYWISSGFVAALAALVLLSGLLERHGLRPAHDSRASDARIAGVLFKGVLAYATIAIVVAIVLASTDEHATAIWSSHWRGGGWSIASITWIAMHVVAMALLVSPWRARTRAVVSAAVLLLIGRALDVFQLVVPASPVDVPWLPWIEIGGFGAGVVPIWLAVFLRAAESPAYPQKDPDARA